MSELPELMVAPNGARLQQNDHPKVPLSIEATIKTAVACAQAGADGLHAHVRDANGNHVLDVALNNALLAALEQSVPSLYTQITTEAVGKYTPTQQRGLVEAIQPRAVSVALREMTADSDIPTISQFYHAQKQAGVEIQHILYDENDVTTLAALCERNWIPVEDIKVLLVLGRYANNRIATPEDLDIPLAVLKQNLPHADWAVCAFGPNETECLVAAHARGGKLRVGFENNIYNANGCVAADNVERVAEIKAALREN